jgi:O-antigen/teichoic acid export membrane protein
MIRESRAVRSGGIVAANHVVAAVITVVSALLLSKALGPREFAIYALCTSMVGVQRIIARLGINVSLLTRKDDPSAADYATALAAMLTASGAVVIVSIAVVPALQEFSRVEGLFWPAIAMTAVLPLFVIPLPAVTMLERQLDYPRVIAIEIAGQLLGQGVSIALAFGGWGIWGPVIGAAIRALLQAVAPWVLIRQTPRLNWDPRASLAMVRFGVGYVVATTLVQGRTFGFLALVGRVFGQEEVGYMGLVLRASGLIAPFRSAVARVILPALAPIADVPDKLRRGVEAVVETEMILSVPLTIMAVAAFGPAVTLLLGQTWLPTIALFPWIAAAAILAAAHAAALSALHIRAHFAESVASSVVSYFVLAAAVFLLTRVGVEGAAAAMLSLWPAAWLQEWLARRRLGTHLSLNGVVWSIGGAAACLSWRLGPFLWLIPVVAVVATYPAIRLRVASLLTALRGPEIPSADVAA